MQCIGRIWVYASSVNAHGDEDDPLNWTMHVALPQKLFRSCKRDVRGSLKCQPALKIPHIQIWLIIHVVKCTTHGGHIEDQTALTCRDIDTWFLWVLPVVSSTSTRVFVVDPLSTVGSRVMPPWTNIAPVWPTELGLGKLGGLVKPSSSLSLLMSHCSRVDFGVALSCWGDYCHQEMLLPWGGLHSLKKWLDPEFATRTLHCSKKIIVICFTVSVLTFWAFSIHCICAWAATSLLR